ELADGLADVGGAAQPAADHHLEAEGPVAGALQIETDVVGFGGRAVTGRGGDRDLELAWQPAELGMDGRPLADRLGPDAGVVDLLGRRAGVGVGGDVADAVPR